jgi:CTP:molybdopterin cytidylyltransferase MocA
VAVAAVVLAAGESKRLGEPKQLVRLGGEALLERAVRVAREAGCSPVVVVLGAAAETMLARCSLGEVRVVVNEDWRKGMGGSVRVGVAALRGLGAAGCVLMTCDQPTVSAEHLRALMASGEVTASAYAGRSGVPAYFPVGSFPALMELEGDAGARTLLPGVPVVELAGGEMDVDSARDVVRMRELLGS